MRAWQEIEESHLRADVRKSPESLRELLAEEFVEFGSSGRSYDREAVIESLVDEPPFEFRIDDFALRHQSDTLALTTYKLSTWRHPGGPVKATLRSSVWVRRLGQWVLLFHQGTVEASGV